LAASFISSQLSDVGEIGVQSGGICLFATPMSAFGGIVLQKSKVAGLRIFRENTKREAIADSYNLNRVTEVAC
jgi:hypothetical protein